MLTTATNFRMNKIESASPLDVKTSTISNFFIQGLENERHKKIQGRKDALLILEVQEKFSNVYKTSKTYLNRMENPNMPFYRLRDGEIINITNY